MPAKYKILIVTLDGKKFYLGEHTLKGEYPWDEMADLTKKVFTKAEYDNIVSTQGYREDQHNYSTIVDAKTFEDAVLQRLGWARNCEYCDRSVCDC